MISREITLLLITGYDYGREMKIFKAYNFLFVLVLVILIAALVLAGMENQGLGRQNAADNGETGDIYLSVTQTLAAIFDATQQSALLPTGKPALPNATQTLAPFPTATKFVDPESYYITDIIGSRQYFALGCEASAAADWANYFGVLIYEYDFQHQLPLSDNPDLGFVGDAKGPWGQVPPYAYGVHAEPVAALLREEYGLPAVAAKGLTLEQIHEKLAQSKPVIAWVIGNMTGGVPAEYTDSQGNTTIVAAYEHVVILTGYDQDSIRYMNTRKFYEVPNEVFLNSWGVLGNMAVMYD